MQVFNVRYKRPRGSGTLLPLQLPHPCLIFQKRFKTSLNKMIENLVAVFFSEKIDFDPSGTPSARGVDFLLRKSEGAKCFCKVWLNFIILFQSGISEYCHQIQMKTKKKVVAAFWFYLSPKFLIACLHLDFVQQFNKI